MQIESNFMIKGDKITHNVFNFYEISTIKKKVFVYYYEQSLKMQHF